MADNGLDFAGLAVPIANASGQVKGTGWLLTPHAVVTCDHVLRDAGFDGSLETVDVDGYTVADIERHPQKDLAVIRVLGTSDNSESPQVKISRDLAPGEQIFAHGYDGNYPITTWPKGHPMDVGVLSSTKVERNTNDLTQEFAVVNGVEVDGGMSGAPVWTESRHGVVGIMSRSDKTINAYIILIEDLLQRWPEFEILHVHRPSGDPTGSLTPISPTTKVTKPIGLPARRPPIAAGLETRLVGRDEAMAELAWRVAQGNDVTVSTEPKTYAVHGLGGIGKTALALEFCHLHQNRFSLVWWVNSETPEAITESYRQLAHELRLPYQNDEHARSQVEAHLAERTNWLAVFDNIPDRASLVHARPQSPTGQIIATSRNPHNWADPMPLPPIQDDPAIDWILAAAGHPNGDEHQHAASQLAENLNGLALALAMATSFISQTKCTIDEYLAFYEDDTLLDNPADIPDDYEQSVFTTWAVSIDKLATTSPSSKLLLEYLAFCAPDQIPIRVFTPDSLQVDAEQPVRTSAINGAIRGLLDYSLASREGGHLWVHRLVQAATRHYLLQQSANG